jgi:hypothetical protein
VNDAVSERIRATTQQYAAVREHPGRFMTAIGHEAPERPVGEVVARNDRYVVVEETEN